MTETWILFLCFLTGLLTNRLCYFMILTLRRFREKKDFGYTSRMIGLTALAKLARKR